MESYIAELETELKAFRQVLEEKDREIEKLKCDQEQRWKHYSRAMFEICVDTCNEIRDLKAQLAAPLHVVEETPRWEPVPDGEYPISRVAKLLVSGNYLQIMDLIDNHIYWQMHLPDDWRIQRRLVQPTQEDSNDG